MYDFYHKLFCFNDLLVFIVSTNMTQNDNSYSWYASFLISVSHIIAIFSHDILYVEHGIVWNTGIVCPKKVWFQVNSKQVLTESFKSGQGIKQIQILVSDDDPMFSIYGQGFVWYFSKYGDQFLWWNTKCQMSNNKLICSQKPSFLYFVRSFHNAIYWSKSIQA